VRAWGWTVAVGLFNATCHTACSSAGGCSGIGIVSPDIRVRNAATGSPICDATVTLVGPGGTGGQVLAPFPVQSDAASDCEYGGPALNFPGSYTMQVSAMGFHSETVARVIVAAIACDATPPFPTAQQVTVELVPL
jgi:hypothetical protein